MKVLFITALLFFVVSIYAQGAPPSFPTCSYPNSNDYCFIAQGLANKVAQALQYRPPCVFQSRLDDITAGTTPFFTTDANVFIAVLTVPDLLVVAASNGLSSTVGELYGPAISSYLTPAQIAQAILDHEKASLEGGNFVMQGDVQEYSSNVFQDANENNFVVFTGYNIGDCCPCQKYDFPRTFDFDHHDRSERDNGESTEVNIYFADMLGGY